MPASTASGVDRGRRNLPVQKRSVEKVDAVLAAARVIMSDPSIELTVREIENRVDFSVGTIYRYFESLDAIVDGVLQQHADAAEDRLGEFLDSYEPASLHDLYVELAELLIAFYQQNPQFTQIQLAGDYWVRYAEIEEASNARLVSQVGDVAIAAGLLASGARTRTRLLVHWSSIGAAFRLAFKDNAQGNRTVLAEIRQMAESFAAMQQPDS